MAGNIKTYDQPNLGLTPGEGGISAALQAAQRERQLGNQSSSDITAAGARVGRGVATLGEAVDTVITHRDISHGSVGVAGLLLDGTNQWNKTVADPNLDPNNPTLASDFLENTLEPKLQAFKEGFHTEKGQQWAQERTDAIRQHFVQKTSADMSALAGIAAVSNVKHMAGGLAATVHDDPSSLDFALSAVDKGVGDIFASSPGLGAEGRAHASVVADEMKGQLVKSAIFGAMTRDPDKGAALAADPRYAQYVNGAEIKQFEVFARAQRNADITAQKQQEQLGANATANEIFASTKGGQVIPPDYFARLAAAAHQYKDVDPGLWRSMATFGQEQTKRLAEGTPIVTDSATYHDFTQRMIDPSQTPLTQPEVFKARALGKLDQHDFELFNNQLERQAKDPVAAATERKLMNSALQSAEGQIDMQAVRAGLSSEKTLRFEAWFLPTYTEALKEPGMTPQKLLSPDSPNYMLTPNVIGRFKAATGATVAPASVGPPDPERQKRLNQLLFAPAQ